MTLQYEPAGSPVMNVVLHALSSLLIATNPSAPVLRARQLSFLQRTGCENCVPRAKAICW